MPDTDIAIIGGGAAGLAAAIFAARRAPSARITILDGARKLGAKILVSGGGRCNVTNAVVTPGDYWGGSANVIKRVLAALPVERTVEFFRELGVTLHEELGGKLFPDSNSARTVLDALLREVERLGVRVLTECRVSAISTGAVSVEAEPKSSEGGRDARPPGGAFMLETTHGVITARAVVLATGGQSLPKTGSDGVGYALARGLGHTLVPTTPALAALVLEGDFHAGLSGVAQDVEITVKLEGARPVCLAGAMLWTHFGVSGPAAMNASRHWHRARLAGREVRLSVNLLPGERFESVEARLIALATAQPRSSLHSALAILLPTSVAMAILERLNIGRQVPLAHLSREQRRRLVHALLEWPLEVRDSRGFTHAEATAGGVPLDEINPATMQSRKCPGLYLAGEILDVDGRIGGFNFQWAWASGYVAAGGIARRIADLGLRIAD